METSEDGGLGGVDREWSRGRMDGSTRMAAMKVAPSIASKGQDDALEGIAGSGEDLLNCLVFDIEAGLVIDRVKIAGVNPYGNGLADGRGGVELGRKDLAVTLKPRTIM